MAKNSLVGSIWVSYFESDSLTSINFSGNKLSGELPTVVSKNTKLTKLNVASNNLSGPLEQLMEIPGLNVLNIESNGFSGPVPSILFLLPLTELYIGGNKFDGVIPKDITNLSALTSLSLGPNLFTGDIPTNLSELTGLEHLSIVEIPTLGGRLPASYGIYLTNLSELIISKTRVAGDIPAQFSNLKKLKTLRLNKNNLRGIIPSSFGLLSNLENLNLNENSLSGTVPSEIGQLSSLQKLHLDSNRLAGTIPEELENLVEIKSMTFDGNFMDGRAPSGVCDLRDAKLDKFVVDCPILVAESRVNGIICSIPGCCTECVNPAKDSNDTADIGTIVSVASRDADLTFLVALVMQAGLVDPLSFQGPFTVFAPVNSGVLSLLTTLGVDPSAVDGVDPSLLYGILTYHVVPGTYLAKDITNGLILKTVMGESVTFAISDDVVTVNGQAIAVTDIPASNGVIHKINGVLIPSTLGNMLF